MKPSLSNSTDRDAILARLAKLTPEAPRLWGKLDAPRMLCHLSDALRVALGELPAQRKDSLLKRTLLKWLVVDTAFQPPPGKVETAPEMLTTKPTMWASDLARCEELAIRVGTGTASAVHPAFGPLTGEEWARLAWKHMDHHLRQFGL